MAPDPTIREREDPMPDAGHRPNSPKRSETRRRTAMVAVRLLPHERETLTAAAHNRQVSLSELLRASALQAVQT